MPDPRSAADEAVSLGAVEVADQGYVCLDIPVAIFDDEAGFWQSLLAWPHAGSSYAEFERLVRTVLRDPAGMAYCLTDRDPG